MVIEKSGNFLQSYILLFSNHFQASDFILTSQLPDLVNACVDGTTNVVDGEMLAEQMHIRGINIRYLGEVLKKVSRFIKK